jgi:hypothetical protein
VSDRQEVQRLFAEAERQFAWVDERYPGLVYRDDFLPMDEDAAEYSIDSTVEQKQQWTIRAFQHDIDQIQRARAMVDSGCYTAEEIRGVLLGDP